MSGGNGALEWAVLDTRWRFEVLPVVKRTAARVYLNEHGRERYRDIGTLCWVGPKDKAEKLCARLTSARSEMKRREAAARTWFQCERTKIIAKAGEA